MQNCFTEFTFEWFLSSSSNVWNRLKESSKCKCCSKPHCFSLLVFFFSFTSVNKRNRKLLLRQTLTTDNARADCSHSRSLSLSLSASLSLSLSLSLHSLQMEWRDLVQGTAAGSFGGRVGSFRARQKLITAVYVFTGTWKLLTVMHFLGGTRLQMLCAVLKKNLARSLLPLLEMFYYCFRFVFLLFDKIWYGVPGRWATLVQVVVLCGRLSEVPAPQEGMFMLILRMKCALVFVNRRVWAFMFVDRRECLLPCGCRTECTECYCSHVCWQNRVSVAVWL